MKKVIALLSLCFTLFAITITPLCTLTVNAYSSDVHEYLTAEALKFLKTKNSEAYDEMSIYQNQLRQGSYDEDAIGPNLNEKIDTYWRPLRHFYRITDGLGYFDGGDTSISSLLSDPNISTDFSSSVTTDATDNRRYPNAYEWASGNEILNKHDFQDAIDAYKAGDKADAYYKLGFVLHLIEDMSVPEHTQLESHNDDPFPTGGLEEGSGYEQFITDQYSGVNENDCSKNKLRNYLHAFCTQPGVEDPFQAVAVEPVFSYYDNVLSDYTTLKQYFDSMATLGYYRNRFQADLDASTGTATGELADMFEISHVSDNTWMIFSGVGLWGGGDTVRTVDTWWETSKFDGNTDDPGWYYIENSYNKLDLQGKTKPEVYKKDWYSYAENEMKKSSSQRFKTPYTGSYVQNTDGRVLADVMAEDMIPLSVQHAAGIMDLFWRETRSSEVEEGIASNLQDDNSIDSVSGCKKSSQSGLATIRSTNTGEDWWKNEAWDLGRIPNQNDNVEVSGKLNAVFHSYSDQSVVEINDLIITNCGILTFSNYYASFYDEEYQVHGDIYNDGKLGASNLKSYGDIINNGEIIITYGIDLVGENSRIIGGSNPIQSKVNFREAMTLTNSPVFSNSVRTSYLLTIETGNSITFYGDVDAFGTIKADKIYLSGNDTDIDNSEGRYSPKSYFEGDVYITSSAVINQDYSINVKGNLTLEQGATLEGHGYSMNVTGDIINNGTINDSCLKPEGTIINRGTINSDCEETKNKLSEVSIATPLTTFTDTANHWAENYINQLYEKGIVKGRTDTTFEPNATINRAEMIKLAVEAKQIPLDQNLQSTSFADVSPDAWYAPYVQAAYNEGIIEGYTEGNMRYFSPESEVIRVDALKILLYSKGYTETEATIDPSFSDVKAGQWFYNLIAYAKNSGIIGGYADGTFRPAQTVTRAEAAKILSEIFY